MDENVDKYDVSGTYDFRERSNDFTGQFLIGGNSRILGKIVDPNSSCPEHIAIGEILKKEGNTFLKFTRVATDLNADVNYLMGKEGSEIEGDYQGKWSFGEEVIPDELKKEKGNASLNLTKRN
ncbi:MAG: hypothetical protein GTN38_00520 [Candidatus Aenigmarchaeota archaeon]|nr:hypothetical protein [Candidatus Aenigmarchaeota archaeon]NIP40068.1 hypothetical protein [Candidatus Aenigmarchaeota archaeon]NIQ18145.1 hypothetical protein [Candidatus Aenigmarchaeota archaeon]NIS72902.1 hypothetical protein [Candidatus Aenigmarchaeota archaeon]